MDVFSALPDVDAVLKYAEGVIKNLSVNNT